MPQIPLRYLFLIAYLAALPLLLGGCEQAPQIERIKDRGELVVATRRAATTYYQGAHGPEGLEYELVSRFAKTLGVKARFVFPDDLAKLIDETRRGHVHFAAASLTVTPEREQFLRFSTPYQTITEQLVYRRGSKRPRSLDDIAPGQLQLIAGSSYVETLQRLQTSHASLSWTLRHNIRQADLLQEVNRGKTDLTVSDSHELAHAQRVLRYLKPALDLSKPQKLAWAFPLSGDKSLYKAANRFLDKLRSDGTLNQLLERYYGHTERMNFVDRRDFRRHLIERLPKYRKHFIEAAEKTGYDWRLLAAIGYQESHWRPDAVSPTGVRGLMMLTEDTAKQVGISDRTDPRQSIFGGADYLKVVERKLPERINQPDRHWLALAGYNVGFGHLEDARILTERQGGNPDLWMDVKQRLPLLSKKKYYKSLKHGFARGGEPLNYVENIRNYYDLLVWYENNQQALRED